ncbi:MAG: 3-methyl-2-oxobutanoate hydroxymethyltransferase [Pseudomonadales bacterium]|jgi:3-methyl-2-oxobutanoate hydroxymethyltransferase|nr:3-methyl-2-oxobutanoate hydroxymethyltransferase [Pseudomonadales bacterium]MDP6471764.1 3-methyl-2-oxobutanoate hydroxymethyltransferase [Pseudomonadales bacterium]MDP6970267.1 3-methyl-2-oxobutanoate hydroxymethyltransferase [Pseudomonadales bacterium]
MNVLDFCKRKRARQNISMVTCYDFWSAQVLNETDIDCLLVGDSLAMVMHGFKSTVHATVDLMALHTRAVRRGAPDKFVVADMPFLCVRKGMAPAMEAVGQLMQAGSNAVKIEGEAGQLDIMAHVVESGVPVMGHLGLTPQFVEAFGGHKVQGRSEGQASNILESAKRLEDAGCFALVLECVPAALGKLISEQLGIPTIGIGAGAGTDGQVLVLQDMLGMNPSFKPRFLRHYASGHQVLTEAVNGFHEDTTSGIFPSREESYA